LPGSQNKPAKLRVDMSAEELGLVVRSLDTYYAYTRAVNRDDARYRTLCERLANLVPPTRPSKLPPKARR